MKEARLLVEATAYLTLRILPLTPRGEGVKRRDTSVGTIACRAKIDETYSGERRLIKLSLSIKLVQTNDKRAVILMPRILAPPSVYNLTSCPVSSRLTRKKGASRSCQVKQKAVYHSWLKNLWSEHSLYRRKNAEQSCEQRDVNWHRNHTHR